MIRLPDDVEGAGDLVRDLTDVHVAMCARLFSPRSAALRAAAAERVGEVDIEDPS